MLGSKITYCPTKQCSGRLTAASDFGIKFRDILPIYCFTVPISCSSSLPLHPLSDQFLDEDLLPFHLFDPIGDVLLRLLVPGDEDLLDGVDPPVADCCSLCYDSNMKIREVIKMLQADGWHLVATRGSHRSTNILPSLAVSQSPVTPGTTSLPAH